VPHDKPCDIDWAIGAVHVMRAGAVKADRPYSERWFMYVEDLDLCWQLRRDGWRVRLEPEVQVTHVGNASGRQAWGDRRTQRWWVATYDWYRSRRGAFAAWRFAATNTLGVAFLLVRARLRRRILSDRSGRTTARIDELGQILPHHWAMTRAPRTAFAGSESVRPNDLT
jgi:GT2 family glycosyltransferase